MTRILGSNNHSLKTTSVRLGLRAMKMPLAAGEDYSSSFSTDYPAGQRKSDVLWRGGTHGGEIGVTQVSGVVTAGSCKADGKLLNVLRYNTTGRFHFGLRFLKPFRV